MNQRDQVRAVINYLAKCGNADIQAGIGQIFGFSPSTVQEAFKEGIRSAIAGQATEPLPDRPKEPAAPSAEAEPYVATPMVSDPPRPRAGPGLAGDVEPRGPVTQGGAKTRGNFSAPS